MSTKRTAFCSHSASDISMSRWTFAYRTGHTFMSDTIKETAHNIFCTWPHDGPYRQLPLVFKQPNRISVDFNENQQSIFFLNKKIERQRSGSKWPSASNWNLLTRSWTTLNSFAFFVFLKIPTRVIYICAVQTIDQYLHNDSVERANRFVRQLNSTKCWTPPWWL